MSRDLWPFYDRELRFFESQAREFANEYPKEAGFLGLGATGRSSDPHVERMIQAFALLAARVHQKIDDDFPELTDGLLNLLYPHYLAPLPSLLVARLVPTTGAELAAGLPVPRHTPFRATAVNGVECEYRTVYPTRLWGAQVTEARLKGPPYPDLADVVSVGGVKARLTLRLSLPTGQPFEAVALGTPDPVSKEPSALRLFLDADAPLTAELYELIFNNVTAVVFREPGELNALVLKPERCIRPVGFRCDGPQDEGVLPYPPTAFPGYRLLTEFFAYRDKFWFFDLAGWDAARAAGVLRKNVVDVHFFFNQSVRPEQEQAVNAETFRPGCVPMVNLFPVKCSDAIDLTRRKYEYTLVPDRDRPAGHEIYSVEAMFHRQSNGQESNYEPFYSFRHQDRDRNRRYWYAARRPPVTAGDRGTDMTVHFVDCDFNPHSPAEELAFATLTCCNRDLPTKLRDRPESWELRPLGVSLPAQVRVIRQPTATLRPMQARIDGLGRADSGRKMTYWRIVSHLALNHLSLTDPVKGREALTEYLALYDFSDSRNSAVGEIARQVREGVLLVDSRRDVAFVPGDVVGGYARGLEVLLELDEDKFVGVGSFLFASILDRFFALAVSLNSYTRLTHSTRQRGRVRAWPPRAGERELV